MPHPAEPPLWLLRWTRRRIAIALGVATAAALGGVALAPPLVDAVLVAAILGSGGVGGWAWRKRAELESLPLELGAVAVRQVVEGAPTLRVRCWLGHGRVMRQIEVRAVLRPGGDREVPVVVEVPVEVATGPVTLTVLLPPLAIGEIALEVVVREGERSWRAEGRYALASVVPGPLDVPIRWADGRLAWDRAGWDRALSQR